MEREEASLLVLKFVSLVDFSQTLKAIFTFTTLSHKDSRDLRLYRYHWQKTLMSNQWTRPV